MMSSVMTPKQEKKLRKLLKSVYYYSISTCNDGIPQATMVQPALTKDWHIIVLSSASSKKVENLRKNNNVWLIADKPKMFNIPRAVYIPGTAELTPLTEARFENFLSYHGWISRRILRKLADKEFDKSVQIEITPEKFITVGVFDKSDKTLSFKIQS